MIMSNHLKQLKLDADRMQITIEAAPDIRVQGMHWWKHYGKKLFYCAIRRDYKSELVWLPSEAYDTDPDPHNAYVASPHNLPGGDAKISLPKLHDNKHEFVYASNNLWACRTRHAIWRARIMPRRQSEYGTYGYSDLDRRVNMRKIAEDVWWWMDSRYGHRK